MGSDNNSSKRTKDDIVLVNKALQGDENAFAKIMMRYKDSIYYTILKMVKNKNDADDLTLEAFGKAFTNLHLYSTDYAFSTWLYKIATNNAIDFLRKKKGVHLSIEQGNDQENESENLIPLKSTSPNPEEKLIRKQRAKMLHRFVRKLKPSYVKLIELRYFKEYSYEEIAKELNLPLGTVKVQLFRARNLLLELVSKTDVND